MFPVQWSANVKLPYYGWFGESGFADKAEARRFVARMLRSARKPGNGIGRPSYSSRCYAIKPHVMRLDDIA